MGQLESYPGVSSKGAPRKICIISQYFPPDSFGGSNRVHGLAKLLHDLGHDVRVITAFPHYPHGVIPREFWGRVTAEETKGGFKVTRVWIFARPNRGVLSRLMMFFSFAASSLLALPQIGKPDFIIVSSPPPFPIFTWLVVAKLKGARFILDVRDLWPESVTALNVTRNTLLIRAFRRAIQRVYRSAYRVVTVSRGLTQEIAMQGAPPNRVVFLPTVPDPTTFQPKPPAQDHLAKLGLKGKILVVYTGVFGIAQQLDLVLKAAKLFMENGLDQFHFLLVGDGEEKERLLKIHHQLGLSNVTFLVTQPKEEISRIINSATVCLSPCARVSLFDSALPTKIAEYLACGKPVLCPPIKEASRLIRFYDCGAVVDFSRPQDVFQTILDITTDRERLRMMEANARRLVQSEFSLASNIGILNAIFHSAGE